MLKRLLAISTLAALAFVRPAAGAGENTMLFLGLGAGARAAALGGATTGWVQDATAAYWNPAGLARVDGWDISGTHTEWLEDIRYEQVALARNRGAHGFGLSFATTYASDFDARDEVGNSTVSFGFSDLSLGLSYAFALSPEFSLGATGKYFRSSIDDVAADGVAFDFGAQYQTPVDGLSVGAAARNLGGKVQYELENAGEYDLPQTVQVGAAYRMPLTALSGDLLLAGDYVAEKNADGSLRLGAQYRYREMFSLMFGWRNDFLEDQGDVAEAEQLDQTQDFSFGAAYDKSFRFEYAFVPFSSDLGSTHRISLGKHW